MRRRRARRNCLLSVAARVLDTRSSRATRSSSCLSFRSSWMLTTRASPRTCLASRLTRSLGSVKERCRTSVVNCRSGSNDPWQGQIDRTARARVFSSGLSRRARVSSRLAMFTWWHQHSRRSRHYLGAPLYAGPTAGSPDILSASTRCQQVGVAGLAQSRLAGKRTQTFRPRISGQDETARPAGAQESITFTG
jgi:hypothetical protein